MRLIKRRKVSHERTEDVQSFAACAKGDAVGLNAAGNDVEEGHDHSGDGEQGEDVDVGNVGALDSGGENDGEDGVEGEVEEVTGDNGEQEEMEGEQSDSSGDDAEGMAAEGSGEAKTGEQEVRKRKTVKPLSKEKMEEFLAGEKRKGVVYISHIPPHMKPVKIRQMLSKHGDIGRVFLNPEDESSRSRRIAKGGSKKHNFTEGWVEFLDKKVAKFVAEALNNTRMGGKHRAYYHDDLWNIKYLSGFKWNHLIEKRAYEKAVREQKLRAEIAQARREKDFYVSMVARAKGHHAMAEKRAKQKDRSKSLPEDELGANDRTGEEQAGAPSTEESRLSSKARTKKNIKPSPSKLEDAPEEEAEGAGAVGMASASASASALVSGGVGKRPQSFWQKRPRQEQGTGTAATAEAEAAKTSLLSKIFVGGGLY